MGYRKTAVERQFSLYTTEKTPVHWGRSQDVERGWEDGRSFSSPSPWKQG